MRKVFLMAVLIGLLPAHAYVGSGVTRLVSPQAIPGLKQERIQIAEGSLSEVDPEMQIIRIETPEGAQIAFHYGDQTQVEGVEDSVTGCFGPKKEPRVRVQFQTVEGVSMAMRIELLASQT